MAEQRRIGRMTGLLVALMVAGLAGCSGDEEAATPRSRPRVGQPVGAAELAKHLAAARLAATTGDPAALQRNAEALGDDFRRSMKLRDPSRPIDHERARFEVRQVPGVQAVAWADRTHLMVVVGRNELRTQATIDRICDRLEPLGDTLGVTLGLQSSAARTGEESQVISRNCQLAVGDRAMLERRRSFNQVSDETWAQHRANQRMKPPTKAQQAQINHALDSLSRD